MLTLLMSLALAQVPTADDAVAAADVTTDGAYDGDVQWVARDEDATRALLADFADEVESGEMSMILDEQGAFLAFTDPVYFETDHYRLRGSEKRMLRRAARVLEDHPGVKVAIVGYADEWANALPEMRAYAVRDYLEDRGVPSAQLLPVGMGVNQYVEPTEEEAANINRRVELRILPELDPSVLGMDRMGFQD